MTAAHNRYRFRLLAPESAELRPIFSSGFRNAAQHRAKLNEVQRLRARVYLHDGAISSESIDREGRFQIAADNNAWLFWSKIPKAW